VRKLRQGPPPGAPALSKGLISALTIELIFDSLAIRLKAEEVSGRRVVVNWRFTDIGDEWVLGLENCALHAVRGRIDPAADVTVTLSRMTLIAIVGGDTTFVDAVSAGDVMIDGNGAALLEIFGHLDTFVGGFAIVEP
jgi:alkyl sulfatase BDS1-like metallo-beta-lactamase superfamily hydrolase